MVGNGKGFSSIYLLLLLALLLAVLSGAIFYSGGQNFSLPNLARENRGGPTVTIPVGLIFGAQIDPQEISQVCPSAQNLGVKATTVWVGLAEYEPQKDQYSWSDLDSRLQPYFNCGIDVGLHLQEKGARWAARGGNSAESPGFGQRGNLGKRQQQRRESFSLPTAQELQDSAFQLATHLKGKVHFYSLENEADSAVGWPAAPQTYFELLSAFNQGVKTADSSNIVEDSGTGGAAYGIQIGNKLLSGGQTQQAISFLNHYYEHFPIGGNTWTTLNNGSDVDNFLAESIPAASLKVDALWMPLLFSSNSQYDRMQMHYYGPWDLLPQLYTYLNTGMQAGGKIRPIDVWELGYGWSGYGEPGQNGYNPTLHAQDTVKLLATAAGEGGNRIIYWRFTDTSGKKPTGESSGVSRTPGLVKDGVPNPAGVAYRTTVGFLSGATEARRLDLGNDGAYGYLFKNASKNIAVVWATLPETVKLPVQSNTKTVQLTDITGKNVGPADLSHLAIGPSPIFVTF